MSTRRRPVASLAFLQSAGAAGVANLLTCAGRGSLRPEHYLVTTITTGGTWRFGKRLR